jgi:hypothetical protein
LRFAGAGLAGGAGMLAAREAARPQPIYFLGRNGCGIARQQLGASVIGFGPYIFRSASVAIGLAFAIERFSKNQLCVIRFNAADFGHALQCIDSLLPRHGV